MDVIRHLSLLTTGATAILFAFFPLLVWPAEPKTLSMQLHNEPVLPIPREVELDPGKVELGKKLFEDKRLSVDNSMACATCHHLNKGGGDGKPLSKAISGKLRKTNTPSIFNLNFMPILGWKGQGSDIGDVAEAIIHSKQGMAIEWEQLIPKLNDIPEYVDGFKQQYNNKANPEKVKDAISTYIRSLITPDSRFDRYLRGERSVLTADEREGYQLFKAYGCSSCHQGVNLGGNMLSKFGIFGDYLADRKKKQNAGLYKDYSATETPRYFRVPSLRNVSLTAPYFHDGSAETLSSAVAAMGRYMLGRKIPDDDVELIVEFLKTLNGRYKGQQL